MTNHPSTDKPYSVSIWGSNPDVTDNDDCWTGDDFATRDEAEQAMMNVCMFPTSGVADHCPDWEFVMLDGPDVHEVSPNPDQKAQAKRRKASAADFAADRSEYAMQAGMAFGCDGYNDAMGY